jgi:hypothetical protein
MPETIQCTVCRYRPAAKATRPPRCATCIVIGKRLDPPKIEPRQRVRRAPRKAMRDWQRPFSQGDHLDSIDSPKIEPGQCIRLGPSREEG